MTLVGMLSPLSGATACGPGGASYGSRGWVTFIMLESRNSKLRPWSRTIPSAFISLGSAGLSSLVPYLAEQRRGTFALGLGLELGLGLGLGLG